MEKYFCLDCGKEFEFDPDTMNTCCQLCEGINTTGIVYDGEDFLVYVNREDYYLNNKGNIPELIVEIDDNMEFDESAPDYWAYNISYGDAKMSGDIGCQIEQLKKNNYSTFSEEAFWETYPYGELQN